MCLYMWVCVAQFRGLTWGARDYLLSDCFIALQNQIHSDGLTTNDSPGSCSPIGVHCVLEADSTNDKGDALLRLNPKTDRRKGHT